MGCTQNNVNHQQYFVNPVTLVRIQTIDGLRQSIKNRYIMRTKGLTNLLYGEFIKEW